MVYLVDVICLVECVTSLSCGERWRVRVSSRAAFCPNIGVDDVVCVSGRLLDVDFFLCGSMFNFVP